MNFGGRRQDDDLEINLIPLIDVLLVILIFLAATTSFTRYREMQIALPQAHAEAQQPDAVQLAVSQDGLYALNGELLPATTSDALVPALRAAMQQDPNITLVINADAHATHESVIRVMEAARMAGINRVNFATQQPQ